MSILIAARTKIIKTRMATAKSPDQSVCIVCDEKISLFGGTIIGQNACEACSEKCIAEMKREGIGIFKREEDK